VKFNYGTQNNILARQSVTGYNKINLISRFWGKDILTIRPSLIDEHLNVSCVEKAEKNQEIWLQTLL